ncbi:hypothetical protein NIES4072_06400 [Nostoc commune NIES-4072]|uniref:Uncharacterized protein n=1 Tax=Nostoc commune NIES-4072 TaxID=2005467 RepID=A0A2R5FL68_NOSCO|nr:hypothetical protein NIES4070_20430 [Nostoc commune HK-02]GBG16993.1 hypothetical protein NIES4072_06400 [Nostoc commune NIES-4072]
MVREIYRNFKIDFYPSLHLNAQEKVYKPSFSHIRLWIFVLLISIKIFVLSSLHKVYIFHEDILVEKKIFAISIIKNNADRLFDAE